MNELLWKAVAKIVAIPVIADYLIERSKKTPYFHLDGYMNRYWLFNPYNNTGPEDSRHNQKKYPWLPSIRVHHILRADKGDHPHDHPWDARTIILKNWYVERRHIADTEFYQVRARHAGDTASISLGEYHHIEHVHSAGAWTLFFTWDYQGTWGFLVDGFKIKWREYVAAYPAR